MVRSKQEGTRIISKDKQIVRELVKNIQGRVAVYIDAANLEKSVQALGLIPPRHVKKGMSWKADRNL